MADLAEEMDGQVNLHGYERAAKDAAPEFREELARAFATGRPKRGAKFTYRSIRGASVADGGDVVVKTIRLRYLHLKGWIEKQKSVKVRSDIVISNPLCSYVPIFPDRSFT